MGGWEVNTMDAELGIVPPVITAAISTTGLSVAVPVDDGSRMLLSDISLDVAPGEFVAIIGPSGCGKSTLLRSLAGIQPLASGVATVAGHPAGTLHERYPMAIGYLSQYGAFHDDLTVGEILNFAVALRLPANISSDEKNKWLSYVIELSQLEPLLRQRYRTLSGGQMRRIALAEALIGNPPFLFLDELTSGLDPHSEEELMHWLASLAHKSGKTILLVTHAVNNIELCDSIIFLNRGRLVYHGDYASFASSFDAGSVAEVYRMADQITAPVVERREIAHGEPMAIDPVQPPGSIRQFWTLARRQALLLARDRGQMILQVALLLTFPVLVAIFAMKGLPEVRNLSLSLESNITKTLSDELLYMKDAFHAASLVSGLAMFQVILLTLMGANNGAREIAKERHIVSKELGMGLSVMAYTTVKLCTVAVFSLAQSFWMTWFVKAVCGFPGDFGMQFVLLFAATFAMSVTCLAISAAASSPEKASLLAIYHVGLQLPLSGAVLALPEAITWVTRPFISAYWGWSGYLKTLQPYRLYDVVKDATKTYIAGSEVSLAVLILHAVIGFVLACYFVEKRSKFYR